MKLFEDYDPDTNIIRCVEENGEFVLVLSMKNREVFKKLKSEFILKLDSEAIYCSKETKYLWIADYLKNMMHKTEPESLEIVSTVGSE